MASIDQFDFTVWKGRLRDASLRYEISPQDPGRSGVVVSASAYDVKPDTITTRVKLGAGTTLNEAAELKDQYRALELTVVDCQDSVGLSWFNVTVLGVSVDISYTVDGYVQVDAVWSLLPDVSIPNV